MTPGSAQMAVCGPCRIGGVDNASCGRLPSTPLNTDGIDRPSFDELAQRGLGDPDVTAHPDEPDTPFRDKSPRETRCGVQDLGCLVEGEQPVMSQVHLCIAPPLAGTDWSGSAVVGAGTVS